MYKKIIITGICLVVIISMVRSQSQSHIGLKGGFGMLDRDGDNRFRILLGGDGAFNVFKQDPLFFQLGLDGELSYQWYNFEDEDIIANAFGLLADFFPVAGMNLAGVIKPSIGGGLTLGVDAGRYSFSYASYYVDYYDFESTSSSIMYGLNLQPCLALDFNNLFAKSRIKYRYLFENLHWEETGGFWSDDSGDEELNTQSLTFILSAGIKSGSIMLEGGIQAENWVSKYKDDDSWPKWPEDWEFLLFLKLGMMF